jgi:hypothetical protein
MLVPRRHGEWLGDNVPNADVVIDERGGHLPDPNLVMHLRAATRYAVVPCLSSRPRVFVVLGEVVEDLMPRSLRADEHVRCRLERWLVDQ